MKEPANIDSLEAFPMRATALSFFIFAFTVSALAQDPSGVAATDNNSRKTLIRELVAQDHGEITAIEPSSKEDGSVVIGYASGAVLICDDSQSCRRFGGTPNVSVEHIAVSRNGASEIIWVTYRQGALYQCANNQCGKFMWTDKPQE
jgi:hypothetical protein